MLFVGRLTLVMVGPSMPLLGGELGWFDRKVPEKLSLVGFVPTALPGLI